MRVTDYWDSKDNFSKIYKNLYYKKPKQTQKVVVFIYKDY